MCLLYSCFICNLSFLLFLSLIVVIRLRTPLIGDGGCFVVVAGRVSLGCFSGLVSIPTIISLTKTLSATPAVDSNPLYEEHF